MTEPTKEYIITTDMLLQWRAGCLRAAMKPYNGDGDICPGCEFDNKKRRGCDFDDDAMQKIFQSRPVNTPPEATAPELTTPITPSGSFLCSNEVHAAIAQAAREEVLKKFGGLVESNHRRYLLDNRNDTCLDSEQITKLVESLRQQKERDQECPRT